MKQRRELEAEILTQGVGEDVTKKRTLAHKPAGDEGQGRAASGEEGGQEERGGGRGGRAGGHGSPREGTITQGLTGFSRRSKMGRLGSNRTLAAVGEEMAGGVEGSGEIS